MGRLCRLARSPDTERVGYSIDVTFLLKNLPSGAGGLCHPVLINISRKYCIVRPLFENNNQSYCTFNDSRGRLHHPNERWPGRYR